MFFKGTKTKVTARIKTQTFLNNISLKKNIFHTKYKAIYVIITIVMGPSATRTHPGKRAGR